MFTFLPGPFLVQFSGPFYLSTDKIHDEGVYLLNNQNTFIKIDKEEEIKDQLRQAYNLALISA